ncbi:MAG TPA: YitT family protein [Anaerolineales bacterium]|nr:YitT family protein [Anaerolineales bacterium]
MTRAIGIIAKGLAQDWLLLTIGGVLLAVNVDLFLAPSKIAPGGVSGMAIILNHFTGWPIGGMMLVLNLPLLLLGFRNLGRFQFLIRTLYVVLLYNLGADVLRQWLPASGVTADLTLNAIYGGVLGGIGTGLVYRGGGTSAGTGILGRVLQIRTGVPVSQVYVLTDGGVILAAGLAFGWERALYAMVALFVWGLTADYVLEGPSVVRTAFIVTDHADKVARAVLDQLGLGVTAWPAQGMFTESSHTVLFCTVSRPEVNALQAVVIEADPQAFVVIAHGHQASGGVIRQSTRGNGAQEAL